MQDPSSATTPSELVPSTNRRARSLDSAALIKPCTSPSAIRRSSPNGSADDAQRKRRRVSFSGEAIERDDAKEVADSSTKGRGSRNVLPRAAKLNIPVSVMRDEDESDSEEEDNGELDGAQQQRPKLPPHGYQFYAVRCWDKLGFWLCALDPFSEDRTLQPSHIAIWWLDREDAVDAPQDRAMYKWSFPDAVHPASVICKVNLIRSKSKWSSDPDERTNYVYFLTAAEEAKIARKDLRRKRAFRRIVDASEVNEAESEGEKEQEWARTKEKMRLAAESHKQHVDKMAKETEERENERQRKYEDREKQLKGIEREKERKENESKMQKEKEREKRKKERETKEKERKLKKKENEKEKKKVRETQTSSKKRSRAESEASDTPEKANGKAVTPQKRRRTAPTTPLSSALSLPETQFTTKSHLGPDGKPSPYMFLLAIRCCDSQRYWLAKDLRTREMMVKSRKNDSIKFPIRWLDRLVANDSTKAALAHWEQHINPKLGRSYNGPRPVASFLYNWSFEDEACEKVVLVDDVLVELVEPKLGIYCTGSEAPYYVMRTDEAIRLKKLVLEDDIHMNYKPKEEEDEADPLLLPCSLIKKEPGSSVTSFPQSTTAPTTDTPVIDLSGYNSAEE